MQDTLTSRPRSGSRCPETSRSSKCNPSPPTRNAWTFHHDRSHGRHHTDPRPLRGCPAHEVRTNLRRSSHKRFHLRPRRVESAPLRCNHGDRTMRRRLQGKGQPGNPAADDDKIVFLHGRRILSISRVCPKRPRERWQNWAARFQAAACPHLPTQGSRSAEWRRKSTTDTQPR